MAALCRERKVSWRFVAFVTSVSCEMLACPHGCVAPVAGFARMSPTAGSAEECPLMSEQRPRQQANADSLAEAGQESPSANSRSDSYFVDLYSKSWMVRIWHQDEAGPKPTYPERRISREPPLPPKKDITAKGCDCASQCGATLAVGRAKYDWCWTEGSCGTRGLTGWWDMCVYPEDKDFEGNFPGGVQRVIWGELERYEDGVSIVGRQESL